MEKVSRPRFVKVLRERALSDGTYDRYWCVLDRKLRKFQVLKVHVTYARSEALATEYAAKLNSMDEKLRIGFFKDAAESM